MATLQDNFKNLLAAARGLFGNQTESLTPHREEDDVNFAAFLSESARDIASFDKKHETAFSQGTPSSFSELSGQEIDLLMQGSPIEALNKAKDYIAELDYLATPLGKLQILKIELGKYVEVTDLHSIDELCSEGLERLSVYDIGRINWNLSCIVDCLGNGDTLSEMHQDYASFVDNELSPYTIGNLEKWWEYERSHPNASDAHNWRNNLSPQMQAFVNQLDATKQPNINQRLADAKVKCAQQHEAQPTSNREHRSKSHER